LELTRNSEGPQVINAYGDGGFRIGGVRHEGSVLVFPSVTLAWDVSRFEDVTAESLAPVMAQDPAVDILLLGCGSSIRFVPAALRDPLREAGVVIEVMDTGAAARTFNVLFAEERRIAAALIAV
jgi:uncharacterized protein